MGGKYAGYYQIPSTPSPTGYTHYLYASYVAAGGVYATYYDTAAATQAIGSPIDMDSLGTTALTRSITTDGLGMATTSNAAGPWSSSLLLKASPDAEYIVRYSGMYKPNGQTRPPRVAPTCLTRRAACTTFTRSTLGRRAQLQRRCSRMTRPLALARTCPPAGSTSRTSCLGLPMR